MPAEAVMRALEHVWVTLEPLGRPMAVMGGIALSAWKHIRATQDVDILIALDLDDQSVVLELLRAAQVSPKREPPILNIGETQILQLLYEPPQTFLTLQIDLLLANSEFHRSALARRNSVILPGVGTKVAVVSCEDLIIYKLMAGRILDRVDAAHLFRANRPRIDLVYLLRWTDQLAVRKELNEIWKEALPDEPTPPDELGKSVL